MRRRWAMRSLVPIAPAAALLLLIPPASAAGQSQGNGTSAAQTQQMISRCKEHWIPACAQYGVPDPNRQPPEPAPPNAFACAIAWRPGCPGEAEAVVSLVQAGPAGGTYPSPLLFSARGFLQSGWPIVVKYRVPPGAIPTLAVTPQFGGGAPFRQELPASDGSDFLYKFSASVPGSDAKVIVADFAITARDKATNAPVPVSILGFGAGPRAVGSIAIDEIRSDPPVIKRPSGNNVVLLTHSYMLENDWDLVSEDLWRDCSHIGILCNFSHPRNPYHPARAGPQHWEWPVKRNAKLGQYQLVIRAWHNCGARVDPAAYHQCGDQLDWVIGSAGPIFIQ